MVGFESEIDAGIYELIHQLTHSQSRQNARERRKNQREPFPSLQRIAIRRGTDMPDESEFFEVRCHDLTRNGFSFLLPSEPQFDAIVAAFGAAPNTIYVAARIVRCVTVLAHATGEFRPIESSRPKTDRRVRDRSAEPMFLVGCHFIARLER